MPRLTSSTALAEAVSWYAALFLTVMLLLLSCCEPPEGGESNLRAAERRNWRACEEIYVVREGETLHSISDKCGDPYIVEENPHIHDPDDVFPGLVIKITPYSAR